MPYLGNVLTSFNVGTDNINNDAVTTAKIADGAILNADVNAAAAIAGTKISPDFGSQNILTTGSATAASLIPTSSTVPTDGVYLPAANSVAISTNGTGRLFVDSSGRVGVGTSSPSSILTVNGKTTLTGAEDTQLEWNLGGQTWRANVVSGGKWYLYDATNTKFPLDVVTNSTCKVDINTSHVAFNTGSTERARIDSSGRLLVGTSSSRTNSNVESAVQIEGTSAPPSCFSLVRNSNDQGRPFILFGKTRSTSNGGSAAVQDADFLGSIIFAGANGTDLSNQAAQIDCAVDGEPFTSGDTTDLPGRLVFSTTADGASSPTERMRIGANGATSLFGDSVVFALSIPAAGTTNAVFVGRYSATVGNPASGTNGIIIWNNGNVVNANNSYGSLSDIKLKENIVDANSQWDDLKALQVRNYNFKEGQTHTQIGLVAQEVELVSPGLVSESPDRDEDGNDLGTVTKSVNYSVLYMKAVKALQEAMERIETLEASNTDLLARVSALESA